MEKLWKNGDFGVVVESGEDSPFFMEKSLKYQGFLAEKIF